MMDASASEQASKQAAQARASFHSGCGGQPASPPASQAQRANVRLAGCTRVRDRSDIDSAALTQISKGTNVARRACARVSLVLGVDRRQGRSWGGGLHWCNEVGPLPSMTARLLSIGHAGGLWVFQLFLCSVLYPVNARELNAK